MNRHKALRSLAALAVLFPAPAARAAEPPPAPLSVESALNALEFAQFAPIDLSPDGKWVAYTLQDPRRVVTDPDPRYHGFDRKGTSIFGLGCDVWITDTQTGQSQNLTSGQGNSYYPVWSPDGRSLVFYSDRSGTVNLWLWERSKNKFRLLSDRIVRSFGGQIARWTPDGRRVIFPVLPEGMTIEQAADLFGPAPKRSEKKRAEKEPTVTVFDSREEKAKSTAWSNRGMVADLLIVDVASSAAARTLTRGLRPSWYQVSPDGQRLAVANMKDYLPGKDFQAVFDLVLVDLSTGASRTLASDIPQEAGNQTSWSPDGSSLAYVTGGESPEGKKGDCYGVSVSGGAPRLLTPGSHPPFSSHGFREPRWDASGQSLYLFAEDGLWRASASGSGVALVAKVPKTTILAIVSPGGQTGRFWSPEDGRSLTLLAREESGKRLGGYWVDLSSGKVTTLFNEEKYLDGYVPSLSMDVSADGTTVVFLSQDSRHPEDLWLAGRALAERRRLTHVNPDFDRSPMGATRLVEWQGLDGETLRGALLLPAGYEEGKRYPTIVYPYGGSNRSNSLFEFGLSGTGTENMQLFATRGYAVFLPDSKTRPGSPMRDIADSVLSGVAKLIELGIADPKRLGVMGHSYGGYSTLSLMVQSKIFKAAVARAGLFNLSGAYGDLSPDGTALNIQWAEGGQGSMGGPLWELRARYIENSPWFYLDRVETPLLIVHGGEDTRVPSHNADELFVGLRRLGKEVVYARYDGEDHSELYWSYANRLDYCRRVIAWFDEHLKGSAADSSKTPGGSP